MTEALYQYSNLYDAQDNKVPTYDFRQLPCASSEGREEVLERFSKRVEELNRTSFAWFCKDLFCQRGVHVSHARWWT